MLKVLQYDGFKYIKYGGIGMERLFEDALKRVDETAEKLNLEKIFTES